MKKQKEKKSRRDVLSLRYWIDVPRRAARFEKVARVGAISLSGCRCCSSSIHSLYLLFPPPLSLNAARAIHSCNQRGHFSVLSVRSFIRDLYIYPAARCTKIPSHPLQRVYFNAPLEKSPWKTLKFNSAYRHFSVMIYSAICTRSNQNMPSK